MYQLIMLNCLYKWESHKLWTITNTKNEKGNKTAKISLIPSRARAKSVRDQVGTRKNNVELN